MVITQSLRGKDIFQVPAVGTAVLCADVTSEHVENSLFAARYSVCGNL